MPGLLITLLLCLPVFGALMVWGTGDNHPKAQHTLAVIFSILTAIASFILLFFTRSQPTLLLQFGPAFGDLIFASDGLAVSLAVIASVLGSLTVLFSVDYMHG